MGGMASKGQVRIRHCVPAAPAFTQPLLPVNCSLRVSPLCLSSLLWHQLGGVACMLDLTWRLVFRVPGFAHWLVLLNHTPIGKHPAFKHEWGGVV